MITTLFMADGELLILTWSSPEEATEFMNVLEVDCRQADLPFTVIFAHTLEV